MAKEHFFIQIKKQEILLKKKFLLISLLQLNVENSILISEFMIETKKLSNNLLSVDLEMKEEIMLVNFRPKRLLNDFNGIGVYRNGFRIRPLGDPDFDWLKLNMRRVQNPSGRIGSNQVIGYV